jgi:hypothetical protein
MSFLEMLLEIAMELMPDVLLRLFEDKSDRTDR